MLEPMLWKSNSESFGIANWITFQNIYVNDPMLLVSLWWKYVHIILPPYERRCNIYIFICCLIKVRGVYLDY